MSRVHLRPESGTVPVSESESPQSNPHRQKKKKKSVMVRDGTRQATRPVSRNETHRAVAGRGQIAAMALATCVATAGWLLAAGSLAGPLWATGSAQPAGSAEHAVVALALARQR